MLLPIAVARVGDERRPVDLHVDDSRRLCGVEVVVGEQAQIEPAIVVRMGDDQILEVVEQRVGVHVLRIRLELGAKGQLAAEIGEFRDRQERRVGALRQRRDIRDVRGGRDAVRIRKLYAVPMGLVPGAFQHQESVLANRRELGDAHVHVGGLERHLLDELPLSLGAFHVVTVDQRAAGCGGDVLAAGRIVLEGVLVADHDLMAGRRYRQRFQALVVHGLSPRS